MRRVVLFIIIYTLAPSSLWSQPVYKSVDKEGNVTYSSTPPEEAQHIEDTGIVSSPTDPNASADNDIERVKQAADELEQDRKTRENQRAKQKEAAAAQEKEKTPAEKPVIQRHRPIIQQPIPPAGGKPTPPPSIIPPVAPVPPTPSPPVAVPLGGGGN
ncbi:DUF4124 domain-containing protein [Kaarinaea lacus]